jgi:WD40 repeat protein
MGRPLIIDGGNVLALALSPDGKFLVSGDGQGAVRLWDIKRRQPVGDIMRTPSAVHGVAFSPSGALLAVTDTSRTVFFWDVAGRRQLEPLNLSQAAILSVAFSPDGRLLALGSGQLDRGLVNKVNIDAQNKLILVDVESRRPLGEIQRSWPVFGISFSPDSKHLASAGGLDAARIWSIDVESWREIACSTANRNFSRKECRQFVGNGVGFRSICPELPEAFN